MSSCSNFPSPPRTPLSNLDIHGNTIYSPTPSPLYLTAKTSQTKFRDAVRSRLDNSPSSSGSAHGTTDNTFILPFNSADSTLSEIESQIEGWGRTRYDTPPRPVTALRPATSVPPSEDDESTVLTPTPKPRVAPPSPRSPTPPPLLLYDGLFVTPPKATTHYPHVLEPITEHASVATLRTSRSTLRQGSLTFPLGGRRSPQARSYSPTLSNASATSFNLSTPHEHTLEVSPPPPARVPTPLTLPIFKMGQTVKPHHVSPSPQCLRDRFLVSATAMPAEHDSRVHTAESPHKTPKSDRERRSNTSLSAITLKEGGRSPGSQGHTRHMLTQRQLRPQKTMSGENGTGSTTTARGGIKTRAGMGMGMNRRRSNAGRKTRIERVRAGTTARGNSGERARLGPKRINRGWDKFRGKISWICCCWVRRAQWEEESDGIKRGEKTRVERSKSKRSI